MQSFLFDQLFYIGAWHPILLVLLFLFGFYLAELSFKKALTKYPVESLQGYKRVLNSVLCSISFFTMSYLFNFNFIYFLSSCIALPYMITRKINYQITNGY